MTTLIFWTVASPPSLPHTASAPYLGQIVEEGPQPQQHRQDDYTGEEACQLEGRIHGSKEREPHPSSRESWSPYPLGLIFLGSLPPPNASSTQIFLHPQ